MKKMISAAAIITSILSLTFGFALAAPPLTYDRVVVGTNTWPNDIDNVQAAVDLGGNILLKGTFNFGNWEGLQLSPLLKQKVNIRKDVGIYGETDGEGNPLTRIIGGGYTFYCPLPVIFTTTPPSLPNPLHPGPKVTIQGLHFDGALLAPINIAYSRGTTITGNKITNVKPYGEFQFSPQPDSDLKKGYLQAGILGGTFYAQSAIPPTRYREGAFTGEVTITHNYIDLKGPNPLSTVAQGILIIYATGMTANISDNVVENAARVGIETTDCYAAGGVGMIVMERNRIVSDEVGVAYMNSHTPNGIIIGWMLDAAEYAEDKNPLHLVRHNSILVKGETGVGITSLADKAVILNNHIVSESASGWGIYIGGSHNTVAHNKIEGIGNYAIQVMPTAQAFLPLELDASYNFLQGNNYNLFDADLFDLHFAPGADHNLFVGHSGSVSDEGDGNRVTNFNFRGKGLKTGTRSNLRGK